MFKFIKTKTMGVAALVLATMGFAPEAKAYDQSYCREYTRTVYIGGMTQNAFGTACLQPDGDWVIVGEGLGNDIPANAANMNYIIHDNNRRVVPARVVYYERPYFRTRNPHPVFVWSRDRHYKKPHYAGYNHNSHKYHRHDRHDHRGKGWGRGRD